MNKQMNEQWWTQLTQEEIDLIEEEWDLFGAHVVSQNEDADRIIEGQDDLGHIWRGTWYNGESIQDIRWKEV